MSDKKLDLILNELQSVKDGMDSMNSEMQSMKGEINSMNGEINSIKDEMNMMKSQLDENTKLTKAIYHRQETDAKLESMSLENVKINAELVSINENITQLINDQKSINELLGEHEISIRTLRRKPM